MQRDKGFPEAHHNQCDTRRDTSRANLVSHVRRNPGAVMRRARTGIAESLISNEPPRMGPTALDIINFSQDEPNGTEFESRSVSK